MKYIVSSRVPSHQYWFSGGIEVESSSPAEAASAYAGEVTLVTSAYAGGGFDSFNGRAAFDAPRSLFAMRRKLSSLLPRMEVLVEQI